MCSFQDAGSWEPEGVVRAMTAGRGMSRGVGGVIGVWVVGFTFLGLIVIGKLIV